MNVKDQNIEHQDTRTPEGEPHVVIVGGGFGGLNAAKAFAGLPVRVTLVDRNNHHLFQPLLYQVATAALSPGEIASPIRGILRRQQNVRVLLGDVRSVDLTDRRLTLHDGDPLEYDYLILAAGARHAYFGHDEWETLAPGLKSLDDALEIRRRILLAFENAEREALERQAAGRPMDRDELCCLLTFVIVGGGPTGVELAGAIAEIARHALEGSFRAIDPTLTRILVVQGGDRILADYPKGLSAAAAHSLEQLGVEIRTGHYVTDVRPDGVMVGQEFVPACTVLWAAGVQASPISRTLGVPLTRAGQVIVEPNLTIPGHREAYVVGDLASLAWRDGKPLPGVAQVAIQQGQWAASNIRRTIEGQPREPFQYREKGNLAIIGRAAAVADFGWLRLSGFVAWIFWLFVHILFLIGFENRLVVMTKWAWSYFTFDRAAMLITGRDRAAIDRLHNEREQERAAVGQGDRER